MGKSQAWTGILRHADGGASQSGVLWQIGTDSNGALSFGYAAAIENRLATPISYKSFGNSVIFEGAWRHVAVVYRAASTNVQLYLDHVCVTSLTLPYALESLASSEGKLLVGRKSGGREGRIDEVRLTRKALDATEMLTDEAAAKPGDALVRYGFDNAWAPSGDSRIGAYAATPEAAQASGGTVPGFIALPGNRRFIYGGSEKGEDTCISMDNVAALTVSTGSVTIADGMRPFIPRTSFTAEAFVRFPAGKTLVQYSDVMSVYDNTAYMIWTVRVDAGSRLYAMFNNRTYIFKNANGAALNDGAWHHVALTCAQNAEGTQTDVKLYVDYAEYAGGMADSAIPWSSTIVKPRIIIGRDNTYFQPFQLDELRYSDGVLAPDKFMRAAGDWRKYLHIIIR